MKQNCCLVTGGYSETLTPTWRNCKTTLVAVSLKRSPHSVTTLIGRVVNIVRSFTTVRMTKIYLLKKGGGNSGSMDSQC